MERPRLSTTLRHFGSVSREPEQFDSESELQARRLEAEDTPTTSELSWKQLVLFLSSHAAKAQQAVLSENIKVLLQAASNIVGSEVDTESLEGVAAFLFEAYLKSASEDDDKYNNSDDDTNNFTTDEMLRQLKKSFGALPEAATASAKKAVCHLSALAPSPSELKDLVLARADNDHQVKGKVLRSGPRKKSGKPFGKHESFSNKGFELLQTDCLPVFQGLSHPQLNLGYGGPFGQLAADNKRIERFDRSWLVNEVRNCIEMTENSLPVQEVVERFIDLLTSHKSNEELQGEMFELLGPNGIELISKMLEHRIDIQNSMKNDFKIIGLQNGTVRSEPTATRAYIFTQVKIQSEDERLLEKALRKEEKRFARYEKHLQDGVLDEEDQKEALFQPQLLRKQRQSALANARVAPIFESRSWQEDCVIHYPHVYDALAEAQKKSSYIGGSKMLLPEGCETENNKTYEELTMPPSQPLPPTTSSDLISIDTLDEIGQLVFSGVKQLNRVQSIVFETAYNTNENLLVCAPTGAGKTNVATLAVLREVRQHVGPGGVVQKDNFKVVYVAPMKALAAEMTALFSKRLQPLGLSVRELTGDMQLSKAEITRTQMLVTTPEKWDVVTRKSVGDIGLSQLVRLLILDEVHLLHDERGPVLESLVSRTLRQMQQLLAMEEVCYDKVVEQLKNNHQVMVFVHARNATVRTAMALLEMAKNRGEEHFFLPKQSASFGDAQKQMQRTRNKQLHELFPNGLAVHHAGMLRNDRSLVENFFLKGFVRVLVCTATLAWGVNLPAHAVIIKGTQIYDAKRGAFVDLGILDVQQIFGRAGRPQFDVFGHGIILTNHDKLAHYLSLLTQRNPIESQFLNSLPDNLNAEITLGTVTSVEEAVKWLSYTYLYVRMRKNPLAYGIIHTATQSDPELLKHREELVKDAGRKLDNARLVRFDERTNYFFSTDLGRISSHFYIKYSTMEIFNELFFPHMNISEILTMVSKAEEFDQIKVREDELPELDDLQCECRLPTPGGVENNYGKVNVLLQTYISRGSVDSFSLISDLSYIAQNSARIVRALFEMALRQHHPTLTEKLLTLSKCLEKRLWPFSHPLRQFSELPPNVLNRLEEHKLTVDRLRDMSKDEIGHLIRHVSMGEKVRQASLYFPTIILEAVVQPITRTVLRVRVSITPDFCWTDRLHGSVGEPWWIWVEDPASDHMYHYESILLLKKQVLTKEPQQLVFTIPIFEPLPSQYYIHACSDRWLGAEAICPINFQHLILPERHPPHTELLYLQPLPVTVLKNPLYEGIYRFTHFNPIQTQIFHTLYYTDCNVLLGAPTGSGKTVAAEIAIFRLFNEQPDAKAVYIAPLKALVRERVDDWKVRIEKNLGKRVVELTGDVSPDMRTIAKADLIVTTPEKWDGVSRSWQNRSYVQKVSLIIIDEIHLLGEDRGPVLEVIVSRTNFISSHTERPMRVVGLSTALANARDLADWLGIQQMGLFNFRPSVRPVPLEVHINGFPGQHYCPRMATMNKPAFQAIKTHSPEKPVLIFVSSRRQTRLTALDLIAFLVTEDNPKQWLHMDETKMDHVISAVNEPNLKLTLAFGIGLHHAGLHERDRRTAEELFVNCKIQVLIATSTLAWGVNFPAHLVIVKGTEYFDGKTHRYVDFPITDVLQMMGRAGRPQFDDQGKAVILVHDKKKAFYKKFLYEPFPVESSLLEVLADHLNAEIASGTITSKQDAVDYLTWTYLFRRLVMNPSYYQLGETNTEAVNKFLSSLVQNTVTDLENAYCIETDQDDRSISPLFLGRIASYYYLKYKTVHLFHDRLNSTCSVEDLLSLLADAEEYAELPVRHNEDGLCAQLAETLDLPSRPMSFDSAHTKALLLLWSHLSRGPLPSPDFYTDAKSVLDQAIRILQAMLDAAANCGWLGTALAVTQLVQMLVQARWVHDETLLTVPNVEKHHLALLKKLGTQLGTNASVYHGPVEVLPELMEACKGRQEAFETLLRRAEMPAQQINQAWTYISQLPMLFTSMSVRDTETKVAVQVDIGSDANLRDTRRWIRLRPGQEHIMVVNIQRKQLARSRFDGKGQTPRFPKQKDEGWILVVGLPDSRELVALKRIGALRGGRGSVTLSFSTPETEGRCIYTVYVMSDSYLGLDQQYDLHADVSLGVQHEYHPV
uniref:activating signal cointegrator 1 complex subunit 3 isoform X2 n=1 Tax=Myxine glutinosa TaxID=7769 RepID=UPI00358EF322